MTYTETQLEAIKLFGRKDLKFGCIVYADREGYNSRQLYKNVGRNKYVLADVWDFDFISKDEWDVDILGHEPHLEDLFRYIENNNLGLYELDQDSITILNGNYIEYDPTLPLIDQPNLSEIVNLFSK